MKNVIRTVSDTEAQVTKTFAKKAVIFGTDEYKLWKAYREDFPKASMVTKQIRKNPNKRVDTRNLTYKNMRMYIDTLDDRQQLFEEFEAELKRSRVQSSSYRYMAAWFIHKFEDYDSYKEFWKQLGEQEDA